MRNCVALSGRAHCLGDSLCDKRQRALFITRYLGPGSVHVMSINVALCIQMYTYVAPNSSFWDAILRLAEQSPAVSDESRKDVLGEFHSVSAYRFHLQVFFGRVQWLLSSYASNVHKAGPPCGPTRVTYSIQAASRRLVSSRCNYPGLGRPKSTQVDPSRRDFFFLDFFLDFADGYSSRFRQPNEA